MAMPLDDPGPPLIDRRRLLRRLGWVGGRLGLGSLGFLSGIVWGGAASEVGAAGTGEALDVQILQTASSLERLAITVYSAALTLPAVKASELFVESYVETSLDQHRAHIEAFQARTLGLGGQVQDGADPRYAPTMVPSVPRLATTAAVVGVLTTLETILRDTYLADVAMMGDATSKMSVAGVMGVEAQHVATLRMVSTLLAARDNSLVATPVPAVSLPGDLGSAGFPDGPFPAATMASPPAEGALP